VALHREGAEDGGGLLLPGLLQRFLPDEIEGFDLRPGESRFDRVVLALELRPHEPVALLDAPGGPVDAGAHRHDPEFLAGLPQPVPHRQSLFGRDIDLPSEVADVGDPEKPGIDRPEVDCLGRAIRERLV
jgi:hypothetical protein